MRELKNVIRMGRTAGLTPAHYAISDVPAGIFDADVFAHSSFSLPLSLARDSMGWRMCSCCCSSSCSCTTGQSRPGEGFEKSNRES